MELIDAIRQFASAEAAAENWSGVVQKVREQNLRSRARKCFSVETGLALASVGVDWQAVMSLIDQDATGRFLLTLLASEGVEWAHPMTVPYLRSKQGSVLSSAGVDALVNLSAAPLFPSLTFSDCQAAVQAQAARDRFTELRNRRMKWDQVAADIRSRIESGQLADNAAVVTAVQSAL